MRSLSRLLLLGVLAIWLLAGLGFYHVYEQHVKAPNTNPLAIIAYSAGLIALAGWMVQSWTSTRNSRKQHTINVLFQTRLSSEFTKHVDNIQARFPDVTPIKYSEVKYLADKSVWESVRFILNYYEFIAVGVRHGDLDEKLLRDCICTQMCTFHNRAIDVLRTTREEGEHGKPAPSKRRVLRNLVWLYWRWEPYATNRRYPWLLRACRRWLCGIGC